MKPKAKQLRRLFASLAAGAMLLASMPLAAVTAFAEEGASGGAWKFAGFGTSTSAAANTVREGADIAGTVSLTSCTVKEDGSIDKKGGKFVADSPADGTVWNGTAFGNVGGDDKIRSGDFTSVVDGGTVTLGVKNNRGKIASTVDGIMMYYVQIPAGTQFTLTATATVNRLERTIRSPSA